MSGLAWAVKNGDLDQVKELVDNKVIILTDVSLSWHDIIVILVCHQDIHGMGMM